MKSQIDQCRYMEKHINLLGGEMLSIVKQQNKIGGKGTYYDWNIIRITAYWVALDSVTLCFFKYLIRSKGPLSIQNSILDRLY